MKYSSVTALFSLLASQIVAMGLSELLPSRDDSICDMSEMYPIELAEPHFVAIFEELEPVAEKMMMYEVFEPKSFNKTVYETE